MNTPVLVWSQVLLVLIDFVLKFGRFFTKFTRVYIYYIYWIYSQKQKI